MSGDCVRGVGAIKFKVHSYVVLTGIPRHGVPTVHYSTVKTLLKAKTV